MQKTILEQIDRLIAESSKLVSKNRSKLTNTDAIYRWSSQVAAFLEKTLGSDQAKEFENFRDVDAYIMFAKRLGFLQGIAAKARDETERLEATKGFATDIPEVGRSSARKVFVVHGHDEAAKEATARFLEKLDLEPINLSFG